MKIVLVAAVGQNVWTGEFDVLGFEGKMPWHNNPNYAAIRKADMTYFGEFTFGHPVVMGPRTFESLRKPLAGRTNIIVTASGYRPREGSVLIAENVDRAIELARGSPGNDTLFVAGGAGVYRSFLSRADTVLITRVPGSFEGDCFFPWEEFDRSSWNASWIPKREGHIIFRYDRKREAV